jgi:SAM-dependent MidA family methyltransferase
MPTPPTWHRAWADAASGDEGFWRSERVADHFRTASNSPLLAKLIARLLRLRPQIRSVVEIGAGDGRLLRSLRDLAPDLRLTGIDLRPPPPDLVGIDWQIARWDTFDARWHPAVLSASDEPTMIICCEWLDDLPCPIAAREADGWRELLVHPDGSEERGDPVCGPHAEWLRRWWPGSGLAEIGVTRDRAWAAVIAALRGSGGAALMVDYGHLADSRPADGSLTAYAAGRQLPACPDPAINLTAQVAVDAIAAAGIETGARTEFLISQREAVENLLPQVGGTKSSPADPLHELQDQGERHVIGNVLGHHWWLLQEVAAA